MRDFIRRYKIVLIAIIGVFFIFLLFRLGFDKESDDSLFGFERIFVKNKELFFDKKIDLELGVNNLIYPVNDSMLILLDEENRFFFYNLNRQQVDKEKKIIAQQGFITYADADKFLYIDRYTLNSVSLNNLESNVIETDSISVFSACYCNDNIYIFLGYSEKDSIANVGFYKLDGDVIQLVHNVENSGCDKDSKFIYDLSYNGNFLITGNYLIYVCSVKSYMYIFDLNGNYLCTIRTKDNVPSPNISVFNDTYIYTRGKTFNSNIGAFIKNDIVYVLSYRFNDEHNVIIDRYSLSDGNYVNSIKVPELSCANNHIEQLFQMGNFIVFYAQEQLYVFNLL